MANQLGMALQHSIVVLADRGWSHRRIARTLGIHRETVSRYVRLAAEAVLRATGPPGISPPARSDDHDRAKPAEPDHRLDDAKPAISMTGSSGGDVGSDRPKLSL